MWNVIELVVTIIYSGDLSSIYSTRIYKFLKTNIAN